uniref:Uncharacterized protein n=1 Tax=Rhizophora mucronata TaxID=61149 RepID=A0A2P2Q8N3_RHIMU
MSCLLCLIMYLAMNNVSSIDNWKEQENLKFRPS